MVWEFIRESVTLTNKELGRLFRYYRGEARDTHPAVEKIVEAGEDYTLRGGKRLRAILILLGYRSKKWDLDPKPVLPLMAAIEFLQSYLLVHDDIMDQDELRRGGPTLHIWFRDYCRSEGLIGDCVHYGVSKAILAGDYLEALAVDTIASADLPALNRVLLLKRYSEGLRAVAYGQYLDVLLSYKPLAEVTETDIVKVHELKTASYTVELPLHLGVLAFNPNEQGLLKLYTRFAKPAGIAFQLRDDILGLYGDPKVTGKPVGSDVREKKKTLLVVKAFENASESERRFLIEVYDRKSPEEITEDDILRVQEIVRETGSLDYSEEKIKLLYEKSIGYLEEYRELDDRTRDVLKAITRYIVYREK